MLHNPIVPPSSKLQSHSQPLPPPIKGTTNTSASPPLLKQLGKLSRRELSVCTNSSLLLLLSSHALQPLNNTKQALAGDNPPESNTTSCIDKTPIKKAFLDISIDGQPTGRIVVGLFTDDNPAGAARFSKLVSGAAGVSYRRKEFIKIMPNYVQHGGIRSYGVDAEIAQRTGGNLTNQSLKDEWERDYTQCPGTKNLAGTVGIVVRDPLKPPPKLKLVARQGKLEIDEEEVGAEPNGTEFVIATKDSPELDASVLVVGRVLEGMEVAQKIGQVKTVQENASSPYFR